MQIKPLFLDSFGDNSEIYSKIFSELAHAKKDKIEKNDTISL